VEEFNIYNRVFSWLHKFLTLRLIENLPSYSGESNCNRTGRL